jgi:HPt (histidine-containing phosphotransfer) domain-containing protein
MLSRFIRDKQLPERIEDAKEQEDIDAEGNATELETDLSLLEAFVQDAKTALPVLETISENIADAAEDDLRLFIATAHAMKSALTNIGEAAASGLASSLEGAGRARDKSAIQARAQELVAALRSIITRIGAKTKNSWAADQDEVPAFLRERLQTISAACSAYDDQAANAALADLEKMFWTKETRTVLGKIAQKLLHSDFDEAGAEARAYIAARLR